jgi:hypothetical protein
VRPTLFTPEGYTGVHVFHLLRARCRRKTLRRCVASGLSIVAAGIPAYSGLVFETADVSDLNFRPHYLLTDPSTTEAHANGSYSDSSNREVCANPARAEEYNARVYSVGCENILCKGGWRESPRWLKERSAEKAKVLGSLDDSLAGAFIRGGSQCCIRQTERSERGSWALVETVTG